MNRKTTAAIACAVLATMPICSQTNEERPAFDVASVKPCDESAQMGTMMQEKTGSLYYRRVNLLAVMRRAYNVDAPQIDGPSWLGSDCYDFQARFPENAAIPRMQQMLQNLLAERFALKVHMEKRELLAFNLVLANSESSWAIRLRSATTRGRPPMRPCLRAFFGPATLLSERLMRSCFPITARIARTASLNTPQLSRYCSVKLR